MITAVNLIAIILSLNFSHCLHLFLYVFAVVVACVDDSVAVDVCRCSRAWGVCVCGGCVPVRVCNVGVCEKWFVGFVGYGVSGNEFLVNIFVIYIFYY